jgi:predicted ester cyclase
VTALFPSDRWRSSGGRVPGNPPTGRSYEIAEIHIFRSRDGRITEHWHQLDAMSLMKQLKDEVG